MDKSELARKIGTLEGRISDAEAQIKKTDTELSTARRNRTLGAAALLVAILGAVSVLGLWPLWAIIGLAGALTLLTAIVGAIEAGKDQQQQQKWMAEARGQLAEWRALITVP